MARGRGKQVRLVVLWWLLGLWLWFWLLLSFCSSGSSSRRSSSCCCCCSSCCCCCAGGGFYQKQTISEHDNSARQHEPWGHMKPSSTKGRARPHKPCFLFLDWGARGSLAHNGPGLESKRGHGGVEPHAKSSGKMLSSQQRLKILHIYHIKLFGRFLAM